MTTLISVFMGAALTFFATHYFKKHDEKNRQKRVIAVINAKLSFCLREFLLIENGPHLYATFQIMSEMLFKNKTFQDISDIKQKLKENDHSDEFKDFDKRMEKSLDKIPMDYLKMYLEKSIKNDFLAPDKECAFLGQPFLIAKIELRTCCEGMLLFLCADSRQREHARSAFAWHIFRGFYLFNELHTFIKGKISSSLSMQ